MSPRTETRPRKKNRKKSKKPRFTAANSDKQVLYQLSVQDVVTEAKFVERVFKKKRRRPAASLREDFCGTALLCGEWVKNGRAHVATGVDIDPAVLAWGREHNVTPLGEAAERITLLQQDVRDRTTGRFDIVVAFNFSYWIFKTRDEMRHYMKTVRRSLGPDGLFLLDAYGGWEAYEPMYESRPIKGGFTYVWDQDKFDPITHDVTNYIHFEFKDGSKLEKAFTYEWRYWTLPELTELLGEAGFSDVRVYWDQAEEEYEEDYRPTKRAENQPGWLAYLVAGV